MGGNSLEYKHGRSELAVGRKIGDGLIVFVRMLKGEAMDKHEVSFQNQLIGLT